MRPVSSPALHTYLEGADPGATKLLTSLDESIRAACPDLDVAIKYGILMYGLRGVCPSVRRRGGGQVRPLQGDSTAGSRGEPSGLEGAQGPVGPDAGAPSRTGQLSARAVGASAQPQESQTPWADRADSHLDAEHRRRRQIGDAAMALQDLLGDHRVGSQAGVAALGHSAERYPPAGRHTPAQGSSAPPWHPARDE